MAGALLVVMLSYCGYLFKASAKLLGRENSGLYRARSDMEKLKSVPFEQLASCSWPGVTITAAAEDLYLIRAGQLYTLRSKYE